MSKFIKALLITLSIIFFSPLFAKNQYTIIIDAGSSGSRMYLYAKSPNGISKISEVKIKPGIAYYNINNESEADTLKKRINTLLDLAKKKLTNEQWAETQVTLYGTAGMRVIPIETQNKIYALIENVIKKSGLKYNNARTISGGEEGLFMWIAVNSGQNKIQNDYGILDMGGDSTQLAFWNDTAANYEFMLNDKTYKIYSQSFLGLGKNLAISQFLQKPACFPNGYQSSEINGEWDLTSCQHEINRFIITQHKTNRTATLPQGMIFQASDNFYHVFYQALGLDSLTLTKIDLAKTLSFCKNLKSIKENTYHSDIADGQICFDAAYFYTLLASYGFGQQEILLQDNSWTKGVAFVLLNNISIKSIK
jgi:apyrase